MSEGTGSGNVLEVKDLTVWFPLRRGIIDVIRGAARRYVKAVDGVSFNVRDRETFCLVGESGCGKTTTGKAILRLVPVMRGSARFKPTKSVLERLETLGLTPEDGYIDIFALDEKMFRPVRRDIQMIYQDPYGSLDPRFRIKDILEEVLLVHKIGESPSERIELVSKALEMVKLTPVSEFIDRYPHQLSGGQRQRVAIARAIISNPRLIIADEPVSMLDVSIRAEILELLNELKERMGVAYIFITHDLAVARYVCDRIAVMYLGKIVELGPSDDIIHDPQHPYTEALVSAIPEPDPSNRLRYRNVKIKGEVPNAIFIPPGCRFHPRCILYEDTLTRYKELGDTDEARAYAWSELCPAKIPPLVEVKKGHYAACFKHEKVRGSVQG